MKKDFDSPGDKIAASLYYKPKDEQTAIELQNQLKEVELEVSRNPSAITYLIMLIWSVWILMILEEWMSNRHFFLVPQW